MGNCVRWSQLGLFCIDYFNIEPLYDRSDREDSNDEQREQALSRLVAQGRGRDPGGVALLLHRVQVIQYREFRFPRYIVQQTMEHIPFVQMDLTGRASCNTSVCRVHERGVIRVVLSSVMRALAAILNLADSIQYQGS